MLCSNRVFFLLFPNQLFPFLRGAVLTYTSIPTFTCRVSCTDRTTIDLPINDALIVFDSCHDNYESNNKDNLTVFDPLLLVSS